MRRGARPYAFCRAFLVAAVVLGGCARPEPAGLTEAERTVIADSIRAESHRLVEVMRGRNVDEVLGFYGKRTAYVGDGVIGNWDRIVAEATPRYRTYAKQECRWHDPLRVDVLSREAAVVTAVLDCEKADTAGRSWREVTARTEVLAREEGRWRIVALHESNRPMSAEEAR